MQNRLCLQAFSMQERRTQGYRELGRSHQKIEGVHHLKMNLRYSITDSPGGCQEFFTSLGLGRTTEVVVMRRTRAASVFTRSRSAPSTAGPQLRALPRGELDH